MGRQLESGAKADAPLDGVRGMLRVHAALKSRNERLSSPALETLVEHETAGTLDEHVEKLLAAE